MSAARLVPAELCPRRRTVQREGPSISVERATFWLGLPRVHEKATRKAVRMWLRGCWIEFVAGYPPIYEKSRAGRVAGGEAAVEAMQGCDLARARGHAQRRRSQPAGRSPAAHLHASTECSHTEGWCLRHNVLDGACVGRSTTVHTRHRGKARTPGSTPPTPYVLTDSCRALMQSA